VFKTYKKTTAYTLYISSCKRTSYMYAHEYAWRCRPCYCKLLFSLSVVRCHFMSPLVHLLLSNRVYPLLGTAQGLSSTQQHPFPWYPPVCTSLSDIPEGQRSGDHLRAVKNRLKLSQKIHDTAMQQVLSGLVLRLA